MRRIIAILLVVAIAFSICGCKKIFADTDESGVVITEPVDNSVNGYRISQPKTETVQKASATIGKYYANKNTKKFHKSDCSFASTIKETNLYICSDRNELINSGYAPCSRCKP